MLVGLGVAFSPLVASGRQGPANPNGALLRVDVAPPERTQFPAADSGDGSQRHRYRQNGIALE